MAPLGNILRKVPFKRNAYKRSDFLVFGPFSWQGPINSHAGAYVDGSLHLANFSSFNALFPNFNILTQELRKLMKTENF